MALSGGEEGRFRGRKGDSGRPDGCFRGNKGDFGLARLCFRDRRMVLCLEGWAFGTDRGCLDRRAGGVGAKRLGCQPEVRLAESQASLGMAEVRRAGLTASVCPGRLRSAGLSAAGRCKRKSPPSHGAWRLCVALLLGSNNELTFSFFPNSVPARFAGLRWRRQRGDTADEAGERQL